MPQGLDAWLDALLSRPLPMLPGTRAELDELMQNNQLSVMQYATPVMYDPGCATQLMKTANRARVDAGRPPLTTMSNVMSHFGRSVLQQQLGKMPYLDDLALPARHREAYLRYVAQACHAARQAQDWAQIRGTHEPEEMQLAALLQNIGELSLWCYGEHAMPAIEQRVYVNRQPWDEASRAVLGGCSLRELSAALAEAWCLSELSIDALHSDYRGFTLATGVALAARLACLTSHSWYDGEARRCLQMIADFKGRSLGEVEPRLHQNALTLNERFQHLGYRPPAAQLPMLVDEDYVDPLYRISAEQLTGDSKAEPETRPAPEAHESAVVKKPVAGAAAAGRQRPEPKTPPRPVKPVVETAVQASQNKQVDRPDMAVANNDSLDAHIARLKQMVNKKAAVQDLIHQVVDSIAAIGFVRVMFALKVPRHKLLLGQFYVQPEQVRPLQNIKIALDRPSLFSLLMEKMQPIRLQDSNRANYWKRIAPPVQGMLGTDRFVAMSVFAGERPLGLMYADKLKEPVSDEEYKKFQVLCRLLSRAVVAVLSARQAATGTD